MYNKKSTKGVRRRPYKRQNSGFERYVADVFCERFNELNISQQQLLDDTGRRIATPTLSRILKGHGGANINNVATLADMLGLEIIIRKKQDNEAED